MPLLQRGSLQANCHYLLGDLEQGKVGMIVKEIASYRLLYARSSRTMDAKYSLTVEGVGWGGGGAGVVKDTRAADCPFPVLLSSSTTIL